MSFYQQIISGIDQVHDALDSGIRNEGNESNLGAIIGVSAPTAKTQSFINDVASYPLGVGLGTLNYALGYKPYIRGAPAPTVPPSIRPLEQGDGFKIPMATTEKVTVTTTTAPKGRGGKTQFKPGVKKYPRMPIYPTNRGLGGFMGVKGRQTGAKPGGAPFFTRRERFNNRELTRARGWKTLSKRKVIRSSPRGGVVAAANAYSARPPGNEVWFGSVKGKPGCLRVKAKIFIATLKMTTSGTTSFQAISSIETGGQWYGSPVMYCYMNNGVIPRMAQYFDEYYHNGSVMEYNTLINSTGTPYAVTWCFCDGYDHWERLGLSTEVSTPTKTQITYMSNSQTFAAWLPSVFIGIPPDSKKYCTAVPVSPTTDYVTWGEPAADWRQTIFGTMGIRVDGANPASLMSMGDVYYHLDFTFCGMSGLQQGYPTMRLKRENKLARSMDLLLSQKLEKLGITKRSSSVKSENKEEDETKSVRRYPPTQVRVDKSDLTSDYDRFNGVGELIVAKPPRRLIVEKEFDSTLGYPGEGPGSKVITNDVKSLDSWDKWSEPWTFTDYNGVVWNEDQMICRSAKELYAILVGLTTDQDFSRQERVCILNELKALENDADFYLFPDDWKYLKTCLIKNNNDWVECAESYLSWVEGLIEVLEKFEKSTSCLNFWNSLKDYSRGTQLFWNYSYCCVSNCTVHGSKTHTKKPRECPLFLLQIKSALVEGSSETKGNLDATKQLLQIGTLPNHQRCKSVDKEVEPKVYIQDKAMSKTFEEASKCESDHLAYLDGRCDSHVCTKGVCV